MSLSKSKIKRVKGLVLFERESGQAYIEVVDEEHLKACKFNEAVYELLYTVYRCENIKKETGFESSEVTGHMRSTCKSVDHYNKRISCQKKGKFLPLHC